MISCDTATIRSATHLIQLAFAEDLQDAGDITSAATIPLDAQASVQIVARENGVLCGGIFVEHVYRGLNERTQTQLETVSTELHLADGDEVSAGSVIATVSGPVASLLRAWWKRETDAFALVFTKISMKS